MRIIILAVALALTAATAHAETLRPLCSYVWIDGYERMVCLDKTGIGPVRK